MRRVLTFFSRSFYSLNIMENSINLKVTRLLQRLKEAEKKSKLLKAEVDSIRLEISTLTTTARSFQNNETSTDTIIINEETPRNSKRKNDELDSFESKKFHNGFKTEEGYVTVYTDGACENNGKANARAGVGIWFGENHPLNISKPVEGRATNNTAEIQACVLALQCLKNEGVDKVKIMTDSQFTINCITKWIHKWKKNDWKLVNGGLVKNKEDLQVLDNIRNDFQDVQWGYVAGHKGIRGNEEADRLARQGALNYRPN